MFAVNITILKKPNHLLVNIEGGISWLDLIKAIDEVMDVNRELDLNVVWNLQDCFSRIQHNQLPLITEHVQRKFPQDAKRSKLAQAGERRTISPFFAKLYA